MKVAVLGSGPAGIAAALTARRAGAEVTVISKRMEPSQQFGCQYLHAPIPGYEDVRSVYVSYKLKGTSDQYRTKVYGQDWDGKVSPEDLVGEHQAWDIRETYRRMWNDFMDDNRIIKMIGEMSTGELRFNGRRWWPREDLFISTVPAIYLCRNLEHNFLSHTIYAKGTTEPSVKVADNQVICNGKPTPAWYRTASVFGYRTTEWSEDPRYSGGVPVLKPLKTDCDCNPEIMRVGRYGSWTKSALVHHVPLEVAARLTEMLNA